MIGRVVWPVWPHRQASNGRENDQKWWKLRSFNHLTNKESASYISRLVERVFKIATKLWVFSIHLRYKKGTIEAERVGENETFLRHLSPPPLTLLCRLLDMALAPSAKTNRRRMGLPMKVKKCVEPRRDSLITMCKPQHILALLDVADEQERPAFSYAYLRSNNETKCGPVLGPFDVFVMSLGCTCLFCMLGTSVSV